MDFLERYDDTDQMSRKVIQKQMEITDEPNNDIDVGNEISYPSLDEALESTFDPNSVTNLQQRFRNINLL